MKLTRLLTVLFCSAVVASIGVASIALATSRAESRQPRSPSISARLIRHFHVFAAARDHRAPHQLAAFAATGASGGVQAILESLGSRDDPSNARQHLDVAATQVVEGSAGPVWLVPGAAGMCVVTATPVAVSGPLAGQAFPYADCDSAKVVGSMGLVAVGLEPDGSHLLYGAVPNGIGRLNVRFSDGSTRSLSVSRNAVTAVVPTLPARVTMVQSDGSQTVALAGGS